MPRYLVRWLVVYVCLSVGVILIGWSATYRTDRGWTPENMARTDISQMEAALAAFRQDFDVTHVPSRIMLSETGNYPRRDEPKTLDADSVQYLRKLWPEIDLFPGSKTDWNGDGRAEGDWVLEGDECLVFFIGGIPLPGRQPGCLGFATGGRDPAARGGARRGPYFPFKSSRLRDLHGRGFLSYLDPYGRGRPYAYFSAYGEPNGYNRYGGTDCPSLKVWPYAEALGPEPRFLNPDSFQILSAGPDGEFGPGSDSPAHTWTPATAGTIPPEGRDDRSNFSRTPLGG